MSNEHRMTDLERYLSYKALLKRPTFDSEEDARANMRAAEGKFRRFLIRGRLGTYKVCYAFMTQPRGSDELQWAYNEEYTFSHTDMRLAENRAALAIGTELVRSME